MEVNNISFPYRSKNKLKSFGIQHDESFNIPRIVKKNQRKITLHHIHGKKTWMTDFMVINGKNIINFIHCNSRYWLAEIVPHQTASAAARVLMMLVQAEPNTEYDYPLIDTLISDDAQALNRSDVIRSICIRANIRQITYNMTITPHSYLALVDRISRTLRDMCFNCKRKNPNWQLNDDTLNDLLYIYNHTPHDTLTKTMGFEVSPYQALVHRNLQNELVRRWMKADYNLTSSWEFRRIQPGMIVYLARQNRFGDKPRNTVEDTPYKVLQCKRGRYTIQRIDEQQPPIVVQRKDFVVGVLP